MRVLRPWAYILCFMAFNFHREYWHGKCSLPCIWQNTCSFPAMNFDKSSKAININSSDFNMQSKAQNKDFCSNDVSVINT